MHTICKSQRPKFIEISPDVINESAGSKRFVILIKYVNDSQFYNPTLHLKRGTNQGDLMLEEITH